MALRIDLLKEAIRLTGGDRQRDYGDPVEAQMRIANVVGALGGPEMSARDVVLAHIATKFARMQASPQKADHYVDLMAYIGILAECEGVEFEGTAE